MSRIKAVLLDADGVIQMPSSTWRKALADLCGDPNASEAFLSDIFAAEKPCVTGTEDFASALAQVLQRWNSMASVDEALQVWTRIDPDREMLELAFDLRQSGLIVALASNQQPYRAAFMSDHLGYASAFDHLLYSCNLGHAKPSAEYFLEASSRLSLPMDRMLFMDDHESNVLAAREVGLHAEVFHVSQGASTARAILQRYGIDVA